MIPTMMNKKKGLVIAIMGKHAGNDESKMGMEDEPSEDELLLDYSKGVMEAIKKGDAEMLRDALKEFVACFEKHPHEEYEEEEEEEEED